MKESKNCNLAFEEMEEVQEFSFGSVSVMLISVTTVLLLVFQVIF